MSGRIHVSILTLWALVAAFPGHAAAGGQGRESPPAMAGTVLPWWDMIAESFVSAAEAMPETGWSFAPKEGAFDGARTFAEQVKHVACANVAFFNEIERRTPPDGCEKGGPDPARTKAEIVRYLRESFAYARRVIETMTPENALDPAGGPYGGRSTRLGLTTLAIWHASDHYGQIVVYLRMNRVVPPASRPR